MGRLGSFLRGAAAASAVAGAMVGPAHAVPDLPPDLPSIASPGHSAPEPASPTFGRASVPFQLQAGAVLALNDTRDPVIPVGGRVPDWTQRIDLRMFGRHSLSPRVGVLANLRLRTQAAEGTDYRADADSHLDVQELALDIKAADWLTVEVGRINVRNGVATGFNPTDWFKSDSLVVADSFDTADRREDRLGTLVVQGAWHNENAVLVTGVRPPVGTDANTWLSDRDVIGLGLDRTNADGALYAKLTPLGSNNVSTTLHAFFEPSQPGVGAEVSGAASETVVLFAEWFAQRRLSLVDESTRSAPLPPATAAALGARDDRRLLHQLAVGASWSLPYELVGNKDVSVMAEYHFNQAGLSEGAMDAWFDAGLSRTAQPGPLWAVRGTAARRQEPLTRHQMFFRFSFNELVTDVDVGAIAFVSPQDGSALIQGNIDVAVLDEGRLRLSAFTAAGPERSAFGSVPGKLGCRAALSYSF